MDDVRIVITGATGNIGTAVLRRLAGHGHDLVGLARRVPTRGLADTTVWHPVDLTRTTAHELAGLFAGADAVVHLAWGFQPSHDVERLRELGVGGTRRVADAVSAARVPHLVHLSSVGAYSPRADDARVDESWPTDGVPTSAYSRHKAAAERVLDDLQARHPDVAVARMRPGIVGQRAAAAALLRYGLPGLVPGRAVRWLPVLPLDRGLHLPVVHSDDVADAVARVLEQRATGAFNLAAEPLLDAEAVADVLGVRLVHVPSSVLRPLVSATWHLRLQQVDTGWLDLALAIPSLDTTRARTELGWTPAHDARAVLAEVVDGMARGDAGETPVLRPRSVRAALSDAWTSGHVARRRRP